MIQLKVMVENKSYRDGIKAEHGLSLYIKTDEMTLLYDTGASNVLADNAINLGVDLNLVDAAIISHGHYDHTGGLPDFAKLNRHAPIYIHKEAFHKFYGFNNGVLEKQTCGIRWKAGEMDMLRPRLSLTEGPLWLSENIVVSGTIPVTKGFIPSEKFYIQEENGELRQDSMAHEQFLGIRDSDKGGVHIFSGCSHTGAVSCIQYAKQLFPKERIISLTGGLHLYNSDAAQRKYIIDQLLAERIEKVIPFHCTGIKAICEISAEFNEACILLHTGDTYIL